METNHPPAASPSGKKPSVIPLLVVGVVLIVIGSLCKGQAWTTPAMFSGLDLDLAMVITNVGLFVVFAPVLRTYFVDPLM